MRAVLDPNVLVSAALSAKGSPAELVRRWFEGGFELVASDALLEELRRVLAYPKIQARVPAEDADSLLELIGAEASLAADPSLTPPVRPDDPDDVYLVALAVAEGAALVSGDRHLLDLAGELPIYTPVEFLQQLE